MWLSLLLVALGLAVAVAGVALVSIPAAFVVAGVAIAAVGILWDFEGTK